MATIPLFNGFYNGLYQFKQPVSKVWYGNFCGVDGPQYNFLMVFVVFLLFWNIIWFDTNWEGVLDITSTHYNSLSIHPVLCWFILKLLAFWSVEWIFIGITFELNLYNI